MLLVAPGATTHANDMHQRAVKLKTSGSGRHLQVSVPAEAGVLPPGYYMFHFQPLTDRDNHNPFHRINSLCVLRLLTESRVPHAQYFAWSLPERAACDQHLRSGNDLAAAAALGFSTCDPRTSTPRDHMPAITDTSPQTGPAACTRSAAARPPPAAHNGSSVPSPVASNASPH